MVAVRKTFVLRGLAHAFTQRKSGCPALLAFFEQFRDRTIQGQTELTQFVCSNPGIHSLKLHRQSRNADRYLIPCPFELGSVPSVPEISSMKSFGLMVAYPLPQFSGARKLLFDDGMDEAVRA
jgi:hypothetical protein